MGLFEVNLAIGPVLESALANRVFRVFSGEGKEDESKLY